MNIRCSKLINERIFQRRLPDVLQVCGRRFARSDERRRHMKIHQNDKSRTGGVKQCVSKPPLTGTRIPSSNSSRPAHMAPTRLPSNEGLIPISALRVPGNTPQKLHAPVTCVQQQQYTPSYPPSFQTSLLPETSHHNENIGKMYGMLQPGNNPAYSAAVQGMLSSNIYTKFEQHDPLFLHNHHMPTSQEQCLI